MQVTSKRHSMVVEFRPHSILTDKFVYTLKFKGDAQSMRLMSRKEMIETVNARLDLHGYVVTDFRLNPKSISLPAADCHDILSTSRKTSTSPVVNVAANCHSL